MTETDLVHSFSSLGSPLCARFYSLRYCDEVWEAGAPVLMHFRRLSDNIYTIHSKRVESKDDLSIHATIELLRGSQLSQRAEAEGEEEPRKKHANKRMLVIRNKSQYKVTISW